ncbi:isoleucine--tRNA ligase [Cellulosimicrobium arenosum]|uniref:Isoleucine--tRNA ligase n=1 Tax=Cellulosimicrobium arenosum TaxID=2708133 RepID=A0A927J005_9MICO|nr:isoleucine--tRNA ligase [Cellulosimicrobium arenosum]MBD8079314.1 isoleucine--tRNA ligase [Cellulosimicrobium arenosum]
MVYPLHRSSADSSYPGASFGIPASPDLPALERGILAYWDGDDTFRASVERNPAGEDGANEFVFYDGPPFANGLPHYGHLLTGYAKDVVPRYQTMRGKHVERRFGWDTHGLPAELEAMDQLGIKTKEEILELGIERFNEACRASVLKYTGEWRDYVTRQARWVDFEHDYKTLDPTFMESVMWAFKSLYDKGLVYEGFRVLPYCWNDQTPLSNHELRMDDDVYQVRQDPAVTVGLRLETGELALVWTTTPWTLPSNLVVMVGPDVDYVVVESSATGRAERYVIAEARLEAYARELTDAGPDGTEGDLASQVVERLKGADLLGRSYTPPFSYYAGHANAHRVVEADFVTTTDGTGLVHGAGAFGEDDKVVSDREGIEPVLPVGTDGKFMFPVVDYESLQVFDANPVIIDHLKARTRRDAGAEGEHGGMGAVTEGTVLLRRESYAHSYPHCWRCRRPLIYMGVSSWFVAVTTFKDRMLELNEQIAWTPEHIQHGQFGKWLANARDWSITRNRFWGSPVPVWKSDDPQHPRLDVYGSFEEIERDFGTLPRDEHGNPDLHRPFVDRLTRPNPDDPTGRSTMRRVEDVLDVWFDSGSMPYAQVHFPFENEDWFSHHNPADFIVEYIGQTRGWFYMLHILSTALFDRPAFSSAISHGIVLGSDGRKMSKSLRNYPDVNEVFDRDGSDAMRWFLMASPILRGGNLVVTEEGIRDAVRQVLLPLWSTYYFFTLYANSSRSGAAAPDAGGYVAQRVTPERVAGMGALDRYLLARTHDLVATATAQLDAYDIAGACESVREHLDVLTNWYVRTQRDRFWGEDADAFDTLYTALETLTRVMAPLAPLLSEEVWRGLTGGRSVHLTDWPTTTEEVGDRFEGADGRYAVAVRHVPEAGLVADPALVAAMDEVRAVASSALGLRKANQLRVRQPLARLTVVVDDPAALAPYTDLLTRELNVKAVELESTDSDAAERFGVTQRLAVNARAAGPRLGRGVQAVIKAAKAGAWRVEDSGDVVVTTADGDVALLETEYELSTVVAATAPATGAGADASDSGPSIAAAVLHAGGFVVLDLTLDDALLAEGYARDVVRDVQDARKAAGLDVADRIRLALDIPGEWVAAVDEHRELVARETLAVELRIETSPTDARAVRVEKVTTTNETDEVTR